MQKEVNSRRASRFSAAHTHRIRPMSLYYECGLCPKGSFQLLRVHPPEVQRRRDGSVETGVCEVQRFQVCSEPKAGAMASVPTYVKLKNTGLYNKYQAKSDPNVRKALSPTQ